MNFWTIYIVLRAHGFDCMMHLLCVLDMRFMDVELTKTAAFQTSPG